MNRSVKTLNTEKNIVLIFNVKEQKTKQETSIVPSAGFGLARKK